VALCLLSDAGALSLSRGLLACAQPLRPYPRNPCALLQYKAGTWRVGGLLALSRAFGDAYLKVRAKEREGERERERGREGEGEGERGEKGGGGGKEKDICLRFCSHVCSVCRTGGNYCMFRLTLQVCA